MSRIGKKPIRIPEGINVEVDRVRLKVSCGTRALTLALHPKVKIEREGEEIKVSRYGDDRLSRSLHGLTRTLIANAIEGLKSGFEKKLEVVGVGYRATLEDGKLKLKVGFSHEVEIASPEGIEFEVKKNIITVKGYDKQAVGETAARIRSVKKPEPYKGKGIRYVGEQIIRKVGKAAKGAGA